MSRHVSTLDLHRFRYGELAGDEAARVTGHLDDCPRCQRRLGAQQTEREAFALSPVPAALHQAAIPERPANRPWPAWLPMAALGVAAAAAALLVVPSPEAPPEPRPAVVDGIRAKGDLPELELWVERDGKPAPMAEGQALAAGDRVQLLFRPHGAPWVTLAGRDGTGSVEIWGSVEPIGQGLQPAPFALELDDAPGPQVFYAVGGDRPLTEREIERALDGSLAGIEVLELSVPKK